jgi:hypothetical protein
MKDQNSELDSELDSVIIKSTKRWIEKVVIGLNFCPFARDPFLADNIHYQVYTLSQSDSQVVYFSPQDQAKVKEGLVAEFERLNSHDEIETSILMYPQFDGDFFLYLDFLDYAQKSLVNAGYEGVYQLASFHPRYCFDGLAQDDPANYTNRSPHSTVHIIRENSLEKAIKSYPQTEKIPQQNMAKARKMGLAAMQQLLADSEEISHISIADEE